MHLPDLQQNVEREIRNCLRAETGERSADERWAHLYERVAAYEQTQYVKVAPNARWSDLYRNALLMWSWSLEAPLHGLR